MSDLLEEDVFTSHPVASRSSHSWHQFLNVAQAQLACKKRTTQPCLLSFLADVLSFFPWHGHLFSQDVYIFLLYIKTFLKSYRMCCDKGTWAPCCECHCGILCVFTTQLLTFLVWHKSVSLHEVLKQDSMPAKHWLISKQGFHSLFVWAWCALLRGYIVPSSSTLRASLILFPVWANWKQTLQKSAPPTSLAVDFQSQTWGCWAALTLKGACRRGFLSPWEQCSLQRYF